MGIDKKEVDRTVSRSATRDVPSTPEAPSADVLEHLLAPVAGSARLSARTGPDAPRVPVVGSDSLAAQVRAGDDFLSRLDGPVALLEAAHAEAGAALARLHASTPRLPEQVRATLPVGLPGVMDLARGHAEALVDVDMDLAHRILQVGALMPDLMSSRREPVARPDSGRAHRARHQLSASTPVLCHGSASPDCVLVEVSTGQVWWTGFDHAVLAPAAVDLGSYLAAADQRAVAPFLDGYTWAGGHLPSSWDLGAAVARAHMDRLLDARRRGEATWRDQAAATLDDLEEGTWRL